MNNNATNTKRPQKWMYFIWGFIAFAVVMLLIPRPPVEPEVHVRTYEHWMGASYPVLISIAGARYKDDNENLSPDDYDLLFKNGASELDVRAGKIVDCGRTSPKLILEENADYFDAIIDFCIDELTI